jgi:hypothetical protein
LFTQRGSNCLTVLPQCRREGTHRRQLALLGVLKPAIKSPFISLPHQADKALSKLVRLGEALVGV